MRLNRRTYGALVVAALGVMPLRVLAVQETSQWFGGSGSWNDAANWTNSPAVSDYPNNGNSGDTWDALVFGGTATMSTDIALQNLIVNAGSGSVNGSGKITAAVGINWTTGTLSNSNGVELSPGGTLTLGGTTGLRTLATSMTNNGTATWLETNGVFGFGPFTNQSTFNITQDGQSGGAFAAAFVNNGTLTKVSGSASRFGGTFSNTGLVVVSSGTRLDFNNSVVQRSTINTVSTLTGGTWNVTGEMHFNNGGDTAIAALGAGASVTLNTSSASFTSIDSLNNNAGTFTITGGRNFTASTFSNTGTLTVGSASTFTVSTSLTQLSGGTLSAGTYSVSGTLALPVSITTNQANFTLSGASSVCTAIDSMTSNMGNFTVSGGRSFTAPFSNSGTVNVSINSSVTITGTGTQSGTFQIPGPNSNLTFSNASQTFNNPSFFTGVGTLTIAGTTNINASSNWNMASFTNWVGGSFGGSGHVTIPSGALLQIQGGTGKALAATMDNSGHVIWTAASGVGGSGGTFNNLAGAFFEIQDANSGAFGMSQFNNAGDVIKTSGSTASNFGGVLTFNNTGSIDAQSGTININGTITQVSGSTLTAGTWKATGATLTLTSASIDTIGPSATVALSGSTSSLNAINGLANNQGSFTITNGRSFTTAGALTNSGMLTIGPSATLVAGGTIHDTGTINFTGGQLNLANRKMVSSEAIGVWNGSSYPELSGKVQLGQIMTTSNFAGLTGVAIAPASETSYVGGMFGGVLVNGGDVLLMYTLKGDANLDAKVNADDYFQIDSHYSSVGDGVKSYAHGDFNYDGKINGDDYVLIDSSFAGQTGFSPSAPLKGVMAVPEPGVVWGLGLVGLVRRRRVPAKREVPKRYRRFSGRNFFR